MFLYYVNEESDDVLMVSLTPKNTESRIPPEILAGAVSFKLGTRNEHHKKKQIDTYSVVAMATPSAPVPFYEKLNIPILSFGFLCDLHF